MKLLTKTNRYYFLLSTVLFGLGCGVLYFTLQMALAREVEEQLLNRRHALLLRAEFVEHLGGASQVYAQAPGGETLTIGVAGRAAVQPGEMLRAGFSPPHAYLFHASGARA